MGYREERMAEDRKDLEMFFLDEYETVQNDKFNRKLPRELRLELNNLFVLRHQFYHTGYINMYLHPERTTNVEEFLRHAVIKIKAFAATHPKYQFALTLGNDIESTLDRIKALGQETADTMRKDKFVANLEQCSTLRMNIDNAILDLFDRMDKDWDTLYYPSGDLVQKEDDVAFDTRSTVTTPYESRGYRNHGSAANELLSNKQLQQIKIDIGMIDREMKIAQSEFHAKQHVQGRGLLPEVEAALVQLSLDRHQFHTSSSNRTFVNPDKQSKIVDSIRASMEVLAANTEDKENGKGALPLSFNFEEHLEAMKIIGREAKENDYQEPKFSQQVADFCEKKDLLDDAIRTYLEATDKEFGTKIAPACKQRENIDGLAVTTKNIKTIIEKEKEFEERMARKKGYLR